MGVTARESPEIIFAGGSGSPNRTTSSSGPAPNMDVGGRGLIDGRMGYNQRVSGAVGSGNGYFRTLRKAPGTLGTAKIAALAHVASGVAMTLAVASTGITVLASGLLVYGSLNTIAVGALVLDGNPGIVNFGQANSAGNYLAKWYDWTTMLGRCVSISGVSGGAGGDFIVNGADIYGFPQSSLVTVAAGANTVNSLKAYKFVTSVVPQFTDAHNYSVGTADIFGFPWRADNWADLLVWWDTALITASTGFVAADTTSPATNATGDTRGTYAVQSAADGSKPLAFAQCPGLARSVTNAGLFGVTPA